jgi:hypothetical protein
LEFDAILWKSGFPFKRFLGRPCDVQKRQPRRRPSESRPRSTNAGEASSDPFRNSGAIKFGQGCKDVQLQPTGGRCAVDTCGDLGPEGLTFVPAEQSPTRKALLIVSNEVSSTTTIWQVE